MEKCQSVWTYNPDSGWLCYFPNNLQKSNLWNMEAGVGYLLLMKDVKDLTIQGTKPNSSVLLKKGKNLVGYNSQTSMYVVDCMKSISGKYISVYKYDPIKKWQWYAPKMPFNGNLHEMKDGEGYWIEALENCFWDINP